MKDKKGVKDKKQINGPLCQGEVLQLIQVSDLKDKQK